MRQIISSFILASIFLFSSNSFAQLADQERLENIVYELADDSYLGRGFGSEQGKEAAQYIISEFEKTNVKALQESGYLHPFFYRTGSLNIAGNNVVAVVEGSDPELKDEYIVIGAHYDHIGWEYDEWEDDTIVYNGADDNTTGVATVLELGRIFQENKELIGRSIVLVAFDGEETGLIGSGSFVEDEIVPMVDIVAMFSVDMIGMYDTHGGVELDGAELLENWKDLLEGALEKKEITIIGTSATVPNRTDTSPFGDEGIPSVHVHTGLESPYHEPEDDADLLEYESMTDVVDLLAYLIMDMSKADEINTATTFEKQSARGYKIFNPGLTMNYGASKHIYTNRHTKAYGVFAGSAGFTLMTRFTGWLALQSEVLYDFSGSKIENTADTESYTGNLHKHAVTVPVSLMITGKDEYMTSWLALGGYYSYAFAGRANKSSLDFEDASNIFPNNDYGIHVGVGFDAENIRIGYYFTYGLLDQDLHPQDSRLRGTYFKVGYMF